jgi:hypothetical protein
MDVVLQDSPATLRFYPPDSDDFFVLGMIFFVPLATPCMRFDFFLFIFLSLIKANIPGMLT